MGLLHTFLLQTGNDSSIRLPAGLVFTVITVLAGAIVSLFYLFIAEKDKTIKAREDLLKVKEDLVLEKERKVKDFEDLKKLMERGTERRS